MDLAIDIIQSYWPALLIVLGVLCLIWGILEVEFWVILPFIFFAGFGVLFFIFEPSEIFRYCPPALLIVLGVVCLIWGIRELEEAAGILSFIFFAGLGVLFFIFEPSEIFRYWPALLIVLGVLCLIWGICEDEVGTGIFGLLFGGSLGLLFFFQEPAQIWALISQFEVIRYLSEGAWYEVVLKISSAIGVIGLVFRILFILLRIITSQM